MFSQLRRNLTLAALPLALVACAPVLRTELVGAIPAPLTEVDVLMHIGSFQPGGNQPGALQPVGQRQRESLERLTPALLTRNGLSVKEFKSVGTADYRRELLQATEQGAPDRYLLLIESDRYVVEQAFSSIKFETRLIDPKTRRTAWRATVSYTLIEGQPNIRAEVFVRDLLLSLAQDRLVRLADGGPVDLKGQPIQLAYVGAKDR